MSEDDHTLTAFDGPIESGKTSQLPHEPEPGQPVLEDHFILESDALSQEHLASIVLPKMLVGPTGTAKERSFLLLTYKAVHDPSVFREILAAAKNGIEKFIIRFTDEENNDIISSWSFSGVRVHALDFGYIAKQRNEPGYISIELAYEQIVIDDFTF